MFGRTTYWLAVEQCWIVLEGLPKSQSTILDDVIFWPCLTRVTPVLPNWRNMPQGQQHVRPRRVQLFTADGRPFDINIPRAQVIELECDITLMLYITGHPRDDLGTKTSRHWVIKRTLFRCKAVRGLKRGQTSVLQFISLEANAYTLCQRR